MTNVIAIFAIFAYLGNTLLIVSDLQQQRTRHTPLYSAGLAVLAHTTYIGLLCHQSQGFSFDFFNTASLVALTVNGLLLLATRNQPIEKAGLVLFPLSASSLVLELLYRPLPVSLMTPYEWRMNLHIFTSIMAFSLFAIAALQAILLAVQNWQLKSHPPKRFIQSLPALQTMENVLFQMIATGLVFLSISLLSGFMFMDNLFAQHLVHKTVLSILAWLLFSSLLLGRQWYGWRGKIAVQWTMSGFVLLLLAYFGSKLVLELILHR